MDHDQFQEWMSALVGTFIGCIIIILVILSEKSL